MVNILAPVAKAATYLKEANFLGLYCHTCAGRYHACKKTGRIRRERSLCTCDRMIAERRMKEWFGRLDKVVAEVKKTTLGQSIGCYFVVTGSMSESDRIAFRARWQTPRTRWQADLGHALDAEFSSRKPPFFCPGVTLEQYPARGGLQNGGRTRHEQERQESRGNDPAKNPPPRQSVSGDHRFTPR